MIIALRRDLWTRLQDRFTVSSFHDSKRFGLSHEDRVPNIYVFCNIKQRRHYDSIRIFCDGKLKNRHLVLVNRNVCRFCFGTDIRLVKDQGVLVCVTCGTVHEENVHGHVSYSESHGSNWVSMRHSQILPRLHSSNVHKRRNHFRFWLARIQGTEVHRVGPHVIHFVEMELKKMPSCDINYTRIRATLKKLGYQRFFNNTYAILKILTGKALVELSSSHEEILLDMFLKIQRPFADHCGHRANMLSYMYLIKKFTQLLGWDQLSSEISLLKSRIKTREQDRIWRLVCLDLGWPFYRSIS